MKPSRKKIQQDDFRAVLRKAGFKATPPRLAILSVLQKAKKPLSPQSIVDMVGKEVDTATVYRTLKALKTADIIRQIHFQHSHAHYELANTHDHHHLICLSCGRVEDIEGCDIDSMKTATLRQAKHFSEIRRHSLEFYGICKQCTK